MVTLDFMYYVTYIAGIILTLSLLMQVHLTYKLQSATGISPFFPYLASLYNTLYTLFLFHFPHPFPPRIMSITTQLTGYLLVFQQFYYPSLGATPAWKRHYLFTSGCLAGIYGAAWYFEHLDFIGQVWGWCIVGIPLFIQLPQVYHNWRRKSVQGFSGWFVVLQVIGTALMLVTCIAFNLPLPLWLNSIRGLVYYAFYSMQFYWYHSRTSLQK